MEPKARPEAELRLPSLKGMMPLAQSFAESSAVFFGLDSKPALSLALAAEEIFLHLCASLPPASLLELRCDGRAGRANLEFRFKGGSGLSLKPFNICAKTPSELASDESLSEMGLILASRSLDSFALREEPGGVMALRLGKERSWDLEALPSAELHPLPSSWTLRGPKDGELPLLAALLEAAASGAPDFLAIPAKAANAISSGLLSLILAVAPDGMPCGAVAWARRETGRAIECFGPYVLPSGDPSAPALAKALLDAFMEAISKDDAPLAIARSLEPRFAATHFEPLPGSEGKAFFRLLEEDEGSTLWLSPEIETSVRDACAKLYLPRRFVSASKAPEGAASVFFSELSRKSSTAMLRPVAFGADVKENLLAHIEALKAEGFKRIRCELELSSPWRCFLAKPLLEAGFKPGVFLPLGGEGDQLIFDFFC